MKKFALISIMVLLSVIAVAQIRIGLNFDYYKPISGFANNVDSSPAGLSLSGLFPLRNKRFTVGADVGVAMYSFRSYDFELINEGTTSEVVEVYEEDCFWHLDGLVRYTLYQDHLIQAFAEAKIGFYTFFSNRWTEDNHPNFRDKTEFHGTSVNAGIGGGVSLNLTNLLSNNPTSNHPIFLDFSSSYNSGSRASYRHMNDEDKTVSNLNDGKYHSFINNMNAKLGVSIQL